MQGSKSCDAVPLVFDCSHLPVWYAVFLADSSLPAIPFGKALGIFQDRPWTSEDPAGDDDDEGDWMAAAMRGRKRTEMRMLPLLL